MRLSVAVMAIRTATHVLQMRVVWRLPLKVPAAVQNVVDRWMSCVPWTILRTQSTINVGRPGASGICVGLEDPNECPRLDAPVCGCDGQTYPNRCRAGVVGVSIASEGPCQPAFCGGFAGFECERGWDCVDVPNDGCDPAQGGADCPGVCVEPQDEPNGACIADRDCREGEWCREIRGGTAVCVPYSSQGDSCGGSSGPWNLERCNPATHHCAFAEERPPLGATGICSPYCMSDNDCQIDTEVCVINPPCLSPAGSNLTVCHGYCFERGNQEGPNIPQ